MSKASEMFKLINQAPMSDEVRKKFQDFANNGDHISMKKYFENCLKSKPEIGVQVQKSGHKSFESIADDIRIIYDKPYVKD